MKRKKSRGCEISGIEAENGGAFECDEDPIADLIEKKENEEGFAER